MNLRELDEWLRKLNYVELQQKKTAANFNYMGLNFNESPIPKMPEWSFFDSTSIAISKGNRFSYVPAHTHEFVEINYMYSGECEQTLNNEVFKFKKNDLLIIDPNVVQKIGYTSENDIIINILIKKDGTLNRVLNYLTGLDSTASKILKNISLNSKSDNYTIYDLNKNEIAQSLLLNLVMMNLEKNSEKNMELILCTFLTQLEPSLIKSQILYNSNNDLATLQILKYIEENYSSTTLKKTSNYFGYNMNYLSNKIKQETGQTFKEIIEQRRLYAAQELLVKTNLTLEKISEKIGYSNSSSINRLFKKYTNTTPINYKKSIVSNPK